jgi:probable HAF family extracellular repeat protein
VSKWILYFGLALGAHGSSLYWSSGSASPTGLNLDSVNAISNSGVAVGAIGGQAAADSVSTNIAWMLGIPGESSFAADINSSNQIAGTFETMQGDLLGFFWSPSAGMVQLGTLGGPLSTSRAINSRGQIVGQAMDAGGHLNAFLWSAGRGMTQAGDSSSIAAVDINDSGEIAFLRGGLGSTILAMNNAGWVIGFTPAGDAFFCKSNGCDDLGTSFVPSDLNNRGEVIGSYQGRPAVWTQSGGFQFLNLGGYSSVTLSGINDSGQIVGDAATVPEPSPILLCLGAFLLAAGWRWRRRPRVYFAPGSVPR